MPKAPVTVLIVDDEPAIRRFLRSTLDVQGWATVEAANGREGLAAARHHRPDIVLLDLGLPDSDGTELIEPFRESGAAVLVLTARGDEASKIKALDGGADDYVTKPFAVGELLARIRTALRHRVEGQGGLPIVEAGELVVDLVYHRVTRGGEEIRLSAKEWAILEQLALHVGKVVTHRHLLTEVWGRATETEAQYLRVYVRQLRQKLERQPHQPERIVTEPGIGYRLLPDLSDGPR